MNHTELLNTYAVVSIATACAILGGDGPPLSEGTVYALVRAGELDKRTKGKITTASIRRYLEEGPCQDANDGRRVAAQSTNSRGGGGLRNGKRPKGKVESDDTSGSMDLPHGLKLMGRYPRGTKRD